MCLFINKIIKFTEGKSKLEKLKVAKENKISCRILNYHAEEQYNHIFKILKIDEERNKVIIYNVKLGELEWSLENISDIDLVQ